MGMGGWVFEIRVLCIALAVLDFALQTRLISNSDPPASAPSVGINGMHHRYPTIFYFSITVCVCACLCGAYMYIQVYLPGHVLTCRGQSQC